MPKAIFKSGASSSTSAEAGKLEKELWQRCKEDPAFFFRHVLKIKTKDGRLVNFEPNAEQMFIINLVTALRSLDLPVRIIILKPRQIGISTAVQALGYHAAMFWPYRHTKVVAHDLDSTEHLFSMSKLFHSRSYPKFRPRTDATNRKELLFSPPIMGRLSLATAGRDSIGHGETIQFGHLSEVSRWPNPGEVVTGIFQAVPRGKGSVVIMESTANGLGNYFQQQYEQHKNQKEQLLKDLWSADGPAEMAKAIKNFPHTLGYIPVFFPWHKFPEYEATLTGIEEKYLSESLTPAEQKLMGQGLKLGHVKFRREKMAEFAASDEAIRPEDKFAEQYPMTDDEAFITSGIAVFDPLRLRAMKESPVLFRGELTEAEKFDYQECRDAHTRRGRFKPPLQEDRHGRLVVWEFPGKNDQYAVAADPAGSRPENDFSVITVFNKRTYRQAAQWRGYIDADILGRFAVQLAGWYNEAVCAIEANNMGISSVVAMRETLYHRPYIRGSQNYRTVQDAPTHEWGWLTTSQTKPMIVAGTGRLIREGGCHFNSRVLVREALAFQKEGNKYSAPEGGHDDCVLAAAICLQIIAEYPFDGQKELSYAKEWVDEKELKDIAEIHGEPEDPVYGELFA